MLIGNYSVLNKTPGSFFAGASISDTKGTIRTGRRRNRFYGEGAIQGVSDRCSNPNGYRPPYAWILAPKTGGLGSNTMTKGTSALSGGIAGGRNIDGSAMGSTAITNAALSLILSAVGTLSGSTGMTASIIGKLEAAGTAAGSSDLQGALGALAGAIGEIIGSTSASGGMTGKGNMVGEITPFTTLSPENLARAVWSQIASEVNDTGTTGEKLNAAGTAGDPWTADLDPYETEGTAGKVLKDKLSTDDFLALK